MKSLIRLFKAVPISSRRKVYSKKLINAGCLEKTIKKGFVFAPEVIANYSDKELAKIISIVDKEIGLSAEQMNSSFHKSWKKVKEADIEQLVMEQMVHYITTYGFEALGVYDRSSVYIPNEKLEIPKLKEGINLTVINGLTEKEIKQKILTFLKTGIALREQTKNDVLSVIKDHVKLNEEEIGTIKNKEVKIALYDSLKLVPINAVEFLRYVIFKSTGKTLLIKDRATIEAIKEADNKELAKLFLKYTRSHGFEKLAEVFYRFKPLFLVFRKTRILKTIINRIRKLAKKHHKPMPEDFLNNITSMIKQCEPIGKSILRKELSKVNTFRKIRLAYALKYRMSNPESILYKVRNGKGYATNFNFKNSVMARVIYEDVLNSIIKDIKKNVKGKKVFIPENMTYALPATEKQFTGDFPSGSYVTVPKDMVFGVHWENTNGHRIDLDLSVIHGGGKIGWDSSYRTDERDILFSGDVTDAPKSKGGASELFYVKRQKMNYMILMVNYFNYDPDVPVPFKILVAEEQVKSLRNNYMVDPNNVKAISNTVADKQQMILGLAVTTTKECRFYFSECNIGQSITSHSGSGHIEHARKYLFDYYKNSISLNAILVKAGAKLVKDKEKCEIDLSPESLEKDKIIGMIA